MSEFSSVDDSPDPARLIGALDRSALGLAAMKQYMAAAARRAVGHGVVVDLGCGAGHDIELLEAAGLDAVGIDASATMLAETRRRRPTVPLVRADGSRLPVATGAVDGCRIERVLQHVDDPATVLADAARILRPGGFLAVFEPDWTSLAFETDVAGAAAVGAVLHRPRQPDMGRRLPALVEQSGFEILDVVVEASRGESIEGLPVRLETALGAAVTAGRVDAAVAEQWWSEQRARAATGRLRARWSKTLVVARRRAPERAFRNGW